MAEPIVGRAAMADLLEQECARRTLFGARWWPPVRQEITHLAIRVSETVDSGGTLVICGNGGSASQAQHFAAEIVGRFKRERPPAPALSLTVDTSALTAIGNDYGFEEIFRRQAEALMRPGDLLIGLSTSGQSPNVVAALAWARGKGMATAALTGRGGGRLAEHADVCVAIPSEETDLIQERHLVVLHMLAEVAERTLLDRV